MTAGERFCGQCGTPRAGNETPAIAPIAFPQQSMSQSAFYAHSQPVQDHPRHAAVTGMRPDEALVESLAEEFPDLFKDPELGGESTSTATQSPEPLVNSQAPSELSLHLKQELETGGDSTVPEIAAAQELAGRKKPTLQTITETQE